MLRLLCLIALVHRSVNLLILAFVHQHIEASTTKHRSRRT